MQDRFDVQVNLPRFSPEELLGLTFLHDIGDGQRVRATITKKILDREAENHERIKMLLTYDDGRIEELITYNELCDIVSEQHDREASGETEIFSFREILDHQGPIRSNDPRYKGSSWNVLIQWEDGSTTWEPLSSIVGADIVTVAAYGKEHGLLDLPGWKKARKVARKAKTLQRMLNQSKRSQRYNAITYKFGVRLPRNVKEAYQLDAENGKHLLGGRHGIGAEATPRFQDVP